MGTGKECRLIVQQLNTQYLTLKEVCRKEIQCKPEYHEYGESCDIKNNFDNFNCYNEPKKNDEPTSYVKPTSYDATSLNKFEIQNEYSQQSNALNASSSSSSSAKGKWGKYVEVPQTSNEVSEELVADTRYTFEKPATKKPRKNQKLSSEKTPGHFMSLQDNCATKQNSYTSIQEFNTSVQDSITHFQNPCTSSQNVNGISNDLNISTYSCYGSRKSEINNINNNTIFESPTSLKCENIQRNAVSPQKASVRLPSITTKSTSKWSKYCDTQNSPDKESIFDRLNENDSENKNSNTKTTFEDQENDLDLILDF